jgi:hypothetical protein
VCDHAYMYINFGFYIVNLTGKFNYIHIPKCGFLLVICLTLVKSLCQFALFCYTFQHCCYKRKSLLLRSERSQLFSFMNFYKVPPLSFPDCPSLSIIPSFSNHICTTDIFLSPLPLRSTPCLQSTLVFPREAS